ncbi:hypothetical protein [Pectinatus cerevisiiphilus]|uniref:Uncharacterized protein n=1 Tax=Pectinatus cerevisiiphilus TaxID=86956 RepID=A0A4R3KEI3_9FIRM|nr:hypothetical protein [Pectinatus cerevisiiphilus]TCS81483.1 hypothetical protein EDC37_102189 [Pectinatus cerevisiiphilus]
MFNHNDMSGKLKFISRMRILAGLLLFVELLAVGWTLAFYFLYPSQQTGFLSISWLLLIGMVIPFNWPGAIVCALLSIFLRADAVLILTAGIYIIFTLLVNRAVWVPNPQGYHLLVKVMRLEIGKSVLLMLAGCFIALVDTGGEEFVTYMVIAVYEFGSAINMIIFYKLLESIDNMDYREIFQVDGKRPYGQ